MTRLKTLFLMVAVLATVTACSSKLKDVRGLDASGRTTSEMRQIARVDIPLPGGAKIGVTLDSPADPIEITVQEDRTESRGQVAVRGAPRTRTVVVQDVQDKCNCGVSGQSRRTCDVPTADPNTVTFFVQRDADGREVLIPTTPRP